MNEVYQLAREIALELGRLNKYVTIDHVQLELMRRGIDSAHLGNAAGHIFVGDHWRCIGYTNSKRGKRKSGLIRMWTLVR